MTVVWENEPESVGKEEGGSRRKGNPVGIGSLLGASQPFQDALGRALRLHNSGARMILISGEPGTGKSQLARGLHYEDGALTGPFLSTKASDLAPRFAAAELFGAAAGQFPGLAESRSGLVELAGRGTLFLEDVDQLPLDAQNRLADWLDREGDSLHERGPRILGTVRSGLSLASSPGVSLAPALRSRLERYQVELPALRHRGSDLEILALHFLEQWSADQARPAPAMENAATESLYGHPWPGNVRELKEVVEAAAALSPGQRIGEEHLRVRARSHRPLTHGEGAAADMILIPPKGKPWERIEEEVVHVTLRITGGNRSAAARILGISRPTLSRKIRKYDLATVGI